jgi:hypothetical protein
MHPRRPRKSSSLSAKLVELSLAVPQVVAHRVARMALAGQTPTDRDKREFERMVAEKSLAFGQSWSAMAVQSVLAQQTLALSLFKSAWSPTRRKPSAGAWAAQFQRAAVDVLTKGVEPVHRKAVANAKRLARTRLR